MAAVRFSRVNSCSPARQIDMMQQIQFDGHRPQKKRRDATADAAISAERNAGKSLDLTPRQYPLTPMAPTAPERRRNVTAAAATTKDDGNGCCGLRGPILFRNTVPESLVQVHQTRHTDLPLAAHARSSPSHNVPIDFSCRTWLIETRSQQRSPFTWCRPKRSGWLCCDAWWLVISRAGASLSPSRVGLRASN